MAGDESAELNLDDIWPELDRVLAKIKFRREHPWTYDIIRALSGSGMTIDQLTRNLWGMRHPHGQRMPKKFRETVQSTLNQHTSQSTVWQKNGANPADD